MRTAVLAVVLFILCGCSAALNCQSEKVQQTSLEVVQAQLERSAWYRDMKPGLTPASFTDIRTVQIDPDQKGASCSATYEFAYNGSPHRVETRYDIAQQDDSAEFALQVDVEPIQVKMMAVGMTQGAPRVGSNVPTAATGVDTCVAQKTDAYHAEMGEDAMVTSDMLAEWEQACVTTTQ